MTTETVAQWDRDALKDDLRELANMRDHYGKRSPELAQLFDSLIWKIRHSAKAEAAR